MSYVLCHRHKGTARRSQYLIGPGGLTASCTPEKSGDHNDHPTIKQEVWNTVALLSGRLSLTIVKTLLFWAQLCKHPLCTEDTPRYSPNLT